jgi:hypothetical protein
MPDEVEFPAVIKKIIYRVRNDGSDVLIKATVGSAQRGVPVAFRDENNGGKLFDLGPDTALIGRVVRVQTFVTDVNPNTNLTVVNYQISGGLQTVMDNTQKEAETAGGRVGHFLFVTFQA